MKHAASQFLYAYWNEIRAERIAPRRFEVEPGRIGGILPDTFILERQGGNAFTFRLAGTRILDRFKTELRGRDFVAEWSREDQVALTRLLHDVTERGAICRLEVEASGARGRTARLEYVLLPLLHTSFKIDRILGVISELGQSAWLGAMPIAQRKLISDEIIWPDGRPFPAAQRVRERPALAPHVRTARIVRADRRQFRVYDGGLISDESN